MKDDVISRQAAIDEIEYELEMINSALDSITLDFNARERLRQRRGEAREILNSIQQLPSAQPEPDTAYWIKPTGMMPPEHYGHYECSNCGQWATRPWLRPWKGVVISDFCLGCGRKMLLEGEG